MTSKERKIFHEISEEIGRWAKENFDYAHPTLGIVEEIGEAAHCILKHGQKIRGFEDHEFYMQNLRDAIGDVMIYLGHREALRFDGNLPLPSHEDVLLSRVLYILSIMLIDRSAGESLFYTLECFSHSLGINPYDAMEETWKKIVAKRDWRADQKDGGGHTHAD